MFTFLSLIKNVLFAYIWSKKSQLSRSLVLKLIGICRIKWWLSLFLFLIGNTFFLGKFGPKSQSYQFKPKFGTNTNSNMQNSIVVLNFFVYGQKCSFWANLVQKVKIISLSWNSVPTLFRICRIQWRCSLFSFSVRNAILGKFGPKFQNCQFKTKFGS